MGIFGLVLGLLAVPCAYEMWACSDEKRMSELEKERIKKIKQGTLNDRYYIEKAKLNRFPTESLTKFEELILNGLKEKKYKLIDEKYCCIEIIAEYENFTVDMVEEILSELFAKRLIDLVKLDFKDGVWFICAELKD